MIAKGVLLKVHRWCGLLLAALLLVQAVTGGMLVFRTGLGQLIDPSGMMRHTTTGEAPLSVVVASIRATYPDSELQRIVYPQNTRATYFAHLVNARGVVRYASVDPGSGAVLRAGSIWRFPIEAVLLIHYELMTDRIGLAVVLVVGLSLLTMATTGLLYWWPRPGRWRGSLDVNWRLPGRVVLRQVHRALGPLIAPVLLLSAITGVILALGLLSGAGPVRSTAPSGLRPVADVNLDQALALARRTYPGRAIRDVRMPRPGAFNVFFWAPEKDPQAVHAVRIEVQSLRILSTSRAQDDHRIAAFVLPIHTGESLGALGKTIILLGGTALAALAATGPMMWIQARRKAKSGRRGGGG